MAITKYFIVSLGFPEDKQKWDWNIALKMFLYINNLVFWQLSGGHIAIFSFFSYRNHDICIRRI